MTFFLVMASSIAGMSVQQSPLDLSAIETRRVLSAADKYLEEEPITITRATSPRSAGGPHEYFSEGDYWWPDPKNPEGPYIQRDGMTNPENFTAHRLALIRLSVQVPAGCGMRKAMEFLYLYIADKSRWPYPPDVMFFEYWPVRQSSLLFTGLAVREAKYLDLWKKLDPDPTNEEVVRNFPIRQLLLWVR